MMKQKNKGVSSLIGVILTVLILIIIVAVVSSFVIDISEQIDNETVINYNQIDNNSVEVIWSEGSGFFNDIVVKDSEGDNIEEITKVGESIIVKDFDEIKVYGGGYLLLDEYENTMNNSNKDRDSNE